MAAASLPTEPPTRRRLRRRPILAFTAVSAALHAALLGLLGPPPEPPNARVEVLDVRLEALEPLRPAATAQAIPPAPPKTRRVEIKSKKGSAARDAAPAPLPPPLREAPAAVLALPHTPTQQPAFTIPQPEPETRGSEANAQVTARSEGAGGAAKAESTASNPGAVTAATAPPAYRHKPEPPYPELARRTGEQGTVMLKVLVARDGVPTSVAVEKTSGSALLDRAAVEGVKRWRFSPARQGTQPVEAWVLVPIIFKLEGRS